MNAPLSFSIAASLVALTLFPVVYLIVNRSTMFRFNRFAITGAMLLSLLIPLLLSVEIPTETATADTVGTVSAVADFSEAQAGIKTTELPDGNTDGNSLIAIALCIYFAGMAVFIFREAVSFIRLFGMIAGCEKSERDGHTVCLLTDTTIAPFSWGNYIFLHEQEFLDSDSSIYLHEKAHTEKRHWLDVMFADAFCILLWYNPFAWMTRQQMKLNHEFEADDAVIGSGVDTQGYQRLLVVKAMGMRAISVTNTFAAGKRSFRKRVLIMSKKRSSRKAALIALCAIPAMVLSATVIASPTATGLLGAISDFTFKHAEAAEPAPHTDIAETATEQTDPATEEPTDTATQMTLPSPLKDQTALAGVIKVSMENMDFDTDKKISLQIVMGKDGLVKEVTTDSPDHAPVATTIMSDLKGVRFEPVTDNGQPVEIRFNIPIQIAREE